MSVTRCFEILILALALVGCADIEQDAVDANIVVIDKRADALTSAQILSANGSYTSCFQRSGSWSVAVTANATLTNSALSVIKGDTSCTLAITSVVTSGGTYTPNSAALALGTSYGTARSFGSPIQFYANAMLSGSFSNNFTLTLLFSADPTVDNSLTKATGYATVSATTVTATGVAAPNYTLDLSLVTVTADISKAVTAVTGNLTLTGTPPGTSYVSVSGSVADTYAAIDTKFTSTASTVMGTIAGSTLLPVSTDLTSGAVRTLIIANTSNGVNSYQKFTVTFSSPT
ncbi:MAG: hypothetical protein JWN04_3288 [Myxococcaceae bacterium]|nr:hypothetical protein [Myxococcaceae bacterium]